MRRYLHTYIEIYTTQITHTYIYIYRYITHKHVLLGAYVPDSTNPKNTGLVLMFGLRGWVGFGLLNVKT